MAANLYRSKTEEPFQRPRGALEDRCAVVNISPVWTLEAFITVNRYRTARNVSAQLPYREAELILSGNRSEVKHTMIPVLQ